MAIRCAKHGYLTLFQWTTQVFPLDKDRFMEYVAERTTPENIATRPPTSLYPFLVAQALIHGKKDMSDWLIGKYQLVIAYTDEFWTAFGEAESLVTLTYVDEGRH